MQEILNNALKLSYASRITVSLLRQDGNINLSVEDNGIGLENEQVEASIPLIRIVKISSIKPKLAPW